MLPRLVGRHGRLAPVLSCHRCWTRASLSRNLSTSEISADEPVESKPWYMRSEEPESAALAKFETPTLPDNSPHKLQMIVQFIAEKLSMDNLLVFDVRSSEDGAYQGSHFVGDFMVIGTGKSAKHLHKATEELNDFVKKRLDTIPSYEGLLKSSDLFTARKRYKRKIKKSPAYALNDYGAAVNSWVMVDTNVDGIYVHFLTKERREEMNLEELWAPEDEKHLYQPRASSSFESDDIFSGIRYFHTSASRMQEVSDLEILEKAAAKGDYRLAAEYNQKFNTFDGSKSDEVLLILKSHVSAVDTTSTAEEVTELERSFSKSFPMAGARRIHWLCRLDFYLALLKRYPHLGYGKIFTDNFIAMQAGGEMLTATDLVEYLKALMQLPVQADNISSSESLANASGLFLTTSPQLLQKVPGSEDLVPFETILPKLVPYLFGLGSQMSSLDFASPNSVSEMSEPNLTKVISAPFINDIARLLTDSGYEWLADDDTSRRNLLLYISILANSAQWKTLWQFVEHEIQHAKPEVFPWRFLLELLAIKGNASACQFFLVKKWPTIKSHIDETEISEPLEAIKERVLQSEMI